MWKLDLHPTRSVLVLIDAQERLLAAMPEADAKRLTRATGILLDTAARLHVPVVVTEQYPKGLGPTVPALADKARAASRHAFVEKLEFDATKNADFERVLAEFAPVPGETSVVLAGMESHICVYQTARGLRERGYTVHVARDATACRNVDGLGSSAVAAAELWDRLGAIATCAETVVFDWLGKAEGDDFKFVSKLVR